MDNPEIANVMKPSVESKAAKILIQESKGLMDLKNMVKELKDVDIYEGIPKLIKYTLTGDDNLLKDAYKKSGIEYISKQILKLLQPFADNLLVEYSLISSTLEPKNPDKLQCCAFAIGDNYFRKCIDEYYTQCIDCTEKKYGITIYQHPNFLYNIPQTSIIEEFKNHDIFTIDKNTVDDNTSTEVVVNGRGLTVSTKCSQNTNKDTSYEDYYLINEGIGGHFKEYNNIYIEAFSLKRHFKDMLSEAKRMASEKIDLGYRLIDIQNCLHSYCHRNITCNSQRRKEEQCDRKISSIYVSFPIYGSIATNQLPQYKISNDALQGIGACFIYFEPKDYSILFDEEKKENLRYILSLISDLVGDFIRFVSANYMYNLGLQLQEHARQEAIKSAKAAIMSRNMSHNIGSHVMSYLKQHLSSVTSMMRDDILQDIISHNDKGVLSWNNEISKEKVNENIALPFLVGIGHFVSYLQERQDFIATIATDYIPYNSTINFKDNIYDELNPDKRYERHSERSNLKIDNILLGNIARSEGLGRNTSPTRGDCGKLCDIILKFGDFDGNLGSSEKHLERLRKFNISLPGGIVGRQAIFSIIENIIRNAAKHGNWKKAGKLELTFDYYSKETIESAPNNDNYEGCSSLREVLESLYKNASDSDDVYFVTITDNTKTDKEHLIRLRKSLCDSYLNSANKGLKEMRISASWLRSIKDEDNCYNPYMDFIDNPEKLSSDSFCEINCTQKAPILYARLHVPGKYLPPNLQYIFCLPIPREVALITCEVSNQEWKDKMRKHNWRVYTENETIHEFLEEESNKSFDFILCDTKETYNKIRPFTSAKTFYFSSSLRDLQIDDFKDVINRDSILDALYKHISNKTNNEIIVIDDKTVFSQAEQLYREGMSEKIEIKAEDNTNLEKVYKIVQVQSFHKEKKTIEGDNYEEIVKEIKDKELYDGFPDGIYYRVGNVVVGNATKPIYSLYSYRSHHEAEEQFNVFMRNVNDYKIRYVEGITGNNASDRLVRHDSLTPRWFYSHMHSMKQKVVIMDERIFYKIYGIDETSFIRGKAYVPKKNTSSGKKDLDEDLADAKIHYKTILPEDAFERIDDAPDMKALQSIISKNYAENIRSNKVSTKGYIGYSYFQKGIMILTFIPTNERYEFELVGIQLANGNVVSNNNTFECTCIPIAKLRWDKSSLSIDLISDFMKFDFISIHQGLLDKLYEAFDIKDNVSAKNNIVEKLYETFSLHDTEEIIKEKDNGAFYPGFFIHSGRSKPSAEVMSQRVPFIQYATLEHAVLDCKYSLIELLDNARYE